MREFMLRFMPIMRSKYVFIVLCLFSFILQIHSNNAPYPRPILQCHDPDVGGTFQNKERKFALLGNENTDGTGLGNFLVFYPSLYYFAAFTGRDIVVVDNSIFGEFCQIITCGFPLLSQMQLAYPKILNSESIRRADVIKHQDMMHYIEGYRLITNDIVVGNGYKSTSDWWVYFNTTVACVSHLTGCDLGDIACADRHAYQRLIRGPFQQSLTEKEEKRIVGVPTNIKHAILTLPHAYAPRLDAAIHIRAQFNHFENLHHINDTSYKKEVNEWLEGEECKAVFTELESMLFTTLHANRLAQNISDDEPSYIYLASDNEDVKDNFTAILEADHSNISNKEHPHATFPLRIMRVEAQFIHHVKQLAKMKEATNNEGLLDLVFDWYALSLANEVFAWRKGGTDMISTFVHSAQRVSGTTERTDPNAPVGHGIGTRGYQLIKDRRGRMRWINMWSYSFLEDYQKKTRRLHD